MDGIKYSVEVQYLTKGNVKPPGGSSADDHAKNAEKMFRGYDRGLAQFSRNASSAFSNSVDGFTSALTSGLTTAVTGAASLLGAGAAIGLKTGIGFADEMERAQIALAAMQNMHLDTPFEQAMHSSRALMETARKDAAALPGTMSDVVNTMKSITAPGLQSGMSMEAIEKMSARTIAMAEIEGVAPKVAASQLAMMLEGRMTSRQAFGRRMGLDPATFNKLSAEDRVKETEKHLAKADPAIAYYQTTFKGMATNVQDQFKNIAKTFATPVYESLKGAMSKGLTWFSSNESIVQNVAYSWGTRIRAAFEWGTVELMKWGPIALDFSNRLYIEMSRLFKMAEPALAKIGKALEHFMSDPEAFKKLEHAAVMLGGASLGAKATGAGLQMGAGLMPLMTSLGVDAAALGTFATVAAGAAAVVGLAGLGIAEGLSDTGKLGDALRWVFRDMKLRWGEMSGDLSRVYSEVIKPAAEAAAVALLAVVDSAMGVVQAVASFTTALLDAVNQLNILISGGNFKDPYAPKGQSWDTSQGKYRDLKGGDQEGVWEASGSFWDRAKSYVGLGNTAAYLNRTDAEPVERKFDVNGLASVAKAFDEQTATKKKVPPNHTTHIHNVTIAVNSNQDPFRVAKATFAALNEVARNPKVSNAALGNGVVR